jgi:hypothetical protein
MKLAAFQGVIQQSQLVVGREHGKRGISMVTGC